MVQSSVKCVRGGILLKLYLSLAGWFENHHVVKGL